MGDREGEDDSRIICPHNNCLGVSTDQATTAQESSDFYARQAARSHRKGRWLDTLLMLTMNKSNVLCVIGFNSHKT